MAKASSSRNPLRRLFDWVLGWAETPYGWLALVLVSFGVTGVFIAQLGVLYQYKWITFALSAACIGYGFYKAYRPIPTEACADGACARPMNRKLMRSILWIATAIVTVAMIFPYLTPYLLSY